MTLMRKENGTVDYEATYGHCHEMHRSYQTKNWGKHFRPHWEHLLRALMTILEVGCGNGRLCKRLAMNGYDVTGLDVVPGPYKRENYRFQVHDITKTPWPFEDQQFSLGLAFDVFEHIEEEAIDRVLKEFLRVSRDQAISIPDCKSIGKLHVTIKPAAWWLEKLKKLSDDKWKIVATEPATKGGTVSVMTRSK